MFAQGKKWLALLLLSSSLSATAGIPVFSVIAVNKAPPLIAANSITHAQYKVTNNSRITRSLVMKPIAGIRQLTGSNLCASPFVLAAGQSCFLDLELDASQMTSFTGGPVICKTKGPRDNSPDPFLCYQPDLQDQLQVSISPCSPGVCLPNPKAAQLREATRLFRDTWGIPGIVSGIWIPGQGNLILEEGFADLENHRYITRMDHFRIGSVTKSFTVDVLLQLIQESLLQLTTPLSQFMPGLQNANADMGQLADMRSGIFNYTEDANFVNIFFSDLTRIWLPQELVDVGNANLPYFPPGTNWHYSNTNTVILGMIIEMITQHPVGEEIRQRILLPLNLRNTAYVETLEMPSPYAHGYGFSPLEDLTRTSPTSAAASGAMISRLEDLYVWSQALGTGKLLTAPMFAAQMASLQPVVFSPCPDNQGRGPVNCPEYDDYGYGIGRLEGWIGHTGEFVGYSLLVMYQPETGASIVILMNLFGAGQHLPTNLFKIYLNILNAP